MRLQPTALLTGPLHRRIVFQGPVCHILMLKLSCITGEFRVWRYLRQQSELTSVVSLKTL